MIASNEIYVVMMGDWPMAAASSIENAKTHALARETRYGGDREFRWDEHRDGLRLMSRTGGKGRFAWTGVCVKTVPTIQGGAA